MQENNNILTISGQKSDILLLVFSSRRGYRPSEGFEFLSTRKELGWSGIFLHDPNKCWYLKGIPGVGDTAPEITRRLKLEIDKLKPKYVVALGFSQGAYASLLFGPLLNVDVIMAYSSQTFLNNEKRIKFNDTRWPEGIENIYKNIGEEEKFLDLSKFHNNRIYKGHAHIFFCKNHREDRLHAANISRFPWVRMEYLECDHHNSAAQFKSYHMPYTLLENLKMAEDRYFGTFFPPPSVSDVEDIVETESVGNVWLNNKLGQSHN